LIRELKLTVLPKESGYLGIVGVSAQKVPVHGRDGSKALAVQSQNYYMLTRELPINYLHWLEPDDTQVLIEGGPVDYFIFCPGKPADKVTLGMDLAKGQRPIVAVPGGCWKALKLQDGAGVCADGECALAGVYAGPGEDWGWGGLGEAVGGECGVGYCGVFAGDDWAELGEVRLALHGHPAARPVCYLITFILPSRNGNNKISLPSSKLVAV
jgi:predicted cupin superfamily sugar epimerase